MDVFQELLQELDSCLSSLLAEAKPPRLADLRSSGCRLLSGHLEYITSHIGGSDNGGGVAIYRRYLVKFGNQLFMFESDADPCAFPLDQMYLPDLSAMRVFNLPELDNAFQVQSVCDGVIMKSWSLVAKSDAIKSIWLEALSSLSSRRSVVLRNPVHSPTYLWAPAQKSKHDEMELMKMQISDVKRLRKKTMTDQPLGDLPVNGEAQISAPTLSMRRSWSSTSLLRRFSYVSNASKNAFASDVALEEEYRKLQKQKVYVQPRNFWDV